MSKTPQFGTAEYQPQAGSNHCKTCGQTIVGQYFRIDSAMTCHPCAEKTGGMLPRTPQGAFTRGLLFGTGGAIAGLILYSVVGIMTGLEIGIVSIAVGYLVARTMLMGTSGMGGRRYQITAVLLTYLAVSMSTVPISLWQFSHEGNSRKSAVVEPVGARSVEASSGDVDAEGSGDGLPGGIVGVVVFLSALGLISPLLGLSDLPSGLIGLVILFVGMRIAWKMTAGSAVQIMGPYHC